MSEGSAGPAPKRSFFASRRVEKLQREIAMLREKDWRVWRWLIFCTLCWMLGAVIFLALLFAVPLHEITLLGGKVLLVLSVALATIAAIWLRRYRVSFFFWVAAYGVMLIVAVIGGYGELIKREDIDSIMRSEDDKEKVRVKIAQAIARREAMLARLENDK
jgi:hypothetical protein